MGFARAGSNPVAVGFSSPPLRGVGKIRCISGDSTPCKARLAQSVERKALNLVVVGSSPTVGVFGLAVDFRRAHEAARRITE